MRDAAARAGRAEETIRRWIWSGRLPAQKVGNIYRIRQHHLDAAVAGEVPVQSGGGNRDLAHWWEKVSRWREANGIAHQSTAADLVLDDRMERSRHAGR